MISADLFLQGVLPLCTRQMQRALGYSLTTCVDLRFPPHPIDLSKYARVAAMCTRRAEAFARNPHYHVVTFYDVRNKLTVVIIHQYLAFFQVPKFRLSVVTGSELLPPDPDGTVCAVVSARRSLFRSLIVLGAEMSENSCRFDHDQRMMLDFVVDES